MVIYRKWLKEAVILAKKKGSYQKEQNWIMNAQLIIRDRAS